MLYSPTDALKLVDVKATGRETTLALAAAHALVRLDDGTIVGDPMERTTLDALNWQLSKGDSIAPIDVAAPHRTHLTVRRRFQFSSALKRMSTVSSLPNGRCIVAAKGAPETIKRMLAAVPDGYDDTYKWYTRRGSRVLALGFKEMDSLTVDKVSESANIRLRRAHVAPTRRSTSFLVTRSSLNCSSLASWCSTARSSPTPSRL